MVTKCVAAFAAVVLCALVLLPGANVFSAGEAPKGAPVVIPHLLIWGDNSEAALIEGYKAYFAKHRPGFPVVARKGSDNGIASHLLNTDDPDLVAVLPRHLTLKEVEEAAKKGLYPTPHVIAHDALAIIVHPANPVKTISIEQLRDIYLGKIDNWKELGGPDLKIERFEQEETDAAGEAFRRRVLNAIDPYGIFIRSEEGNETALEKVKGSPGGISYVRAHVFLKAKKPPKAAKYLAVNGVSLTRETIRTGEYPITWEVVMYTARCATTDLVLGSDTHRCVTLHLTPEGQKIIDSTLCFPLTTYEKQVAPK